MPAILANAKQFRYNSDYPTDKVVYQQTYTVAVSAFNFNDVSFPHSLGFTPLVSAQWSMSSSMVPTYGISSGPRTGTNLTYQTGIDADSTNIYLATTNNTASNVTLYFAIYGFMPSGVNVDAPFTRFTEDNFTYSSDYNYSKLLTADQFSVGTGTSTVNVPHNLGYEPQASVWVERAGRIAPFVYTDVITSVAPFDQVNISMTTTHMVCEFTDLSAARTIHYRIYLDD